MSEQEATSHSRIVPFEPRSERPPVTTKPRDWDACQHKGPLEVDQTLRRVECVACHEVLDPIQVLIEMAHGYREQDYKLDKMREFEEKERAIEDRRRARDAKRLAKNGTQYHYEISGRSS